jgi:NAD(P)-dependent dehydrogenase (short-subunit alcohol dehydrogenase family)
MAIVAVPAPREAVAALFDLTGRTALVTGASRGIGAYAAHVLDAAGARVVLTARDAVKLQEVSGSLVNDPVTVPSDLSDSAGVARLLDAVHDAVGAPDVVVNNAGAHVPGAATELNEADWDGVLSLNLRSAFLLARGLIPGMAERGWGKVINVASILGLVGDVHAAPYVTSKAGLIGMTRALACEWAGRGVCVNALCPGWIDTDMVGDLRQSRSFDRRVIRRTPVGRWGTPEDLAGAIVFLSSHASDFMIGHALVVDGGLSAWW